MDLGVFIPIGNNGWLISTASPQYKPSFDLNRAARRNDCQAPPAGTRWLVQYVGGPPWPCARTVSDLHR